MKWEWLLLIPATFCILYGIMVLGIGSGTGFFLVWFLLGGLFLLLIPAIGLRIWMYIPRPVTVGLAVLLTAGIVIFLTVEGKILGCFGSVPEKDLDYLIVLGAQVYESGPSVVLQYRLDAAADYLLENPRTQCIVTGGQGYNEPFAEAEGMRDYLVSKGIGGERILLEDKAGNTRENMVFSAAFLDPAKDRTGIVTNDFHVFRALRLAKKAGYEKVSALSAGSTPLFLPNNLLREFLGFVKDLLAGNI